MFSEKKKSVFEVESGKKKSGFGSFGNVTTNWLFIIILFYFLI